ncbi:cupredoxin domain-containing protein [Marinobacter halodurans]|uniref:Cupredoxin domain-containing protein n=1 Tax=Marinobacter halodurans TaxID=2528979 RepID=A0ABY1ZF25_9GAMM|nr:cupredoxin domain-containing protein [Marinobacter halodurans]TBW49104.1 cupredoxin domain-containing protein [Marinobacter halodurans]
MPNRTFSAAAILLTMLVALPAAAEMKTYDIELKDGQVTPKTLDVPAGERFKLKVHNNGEAPAEFESKRLRQEKILVPGANWAVVIKPLEAGEYDYFDEFNMPEAQGTLIAR